MGLATIDPHSHKVQAKLYKRNVWPFGRSEHSDRMAIHFFFKWLYLSQN